ncbi:putative vacuolar membrane protein [Cladophialophora carrionii]|uniref:Putative vacuolar membrane protein n=1 Tax=Cladophialophora carrionii TaxID=86049 RepID=A0A1C1C8Y7_9EURO|nr:putative vacuolar membrane protein [Cladophialophora carrionii]
MVDILSLSPSSSLEIEMDDHGSASRDHSRQKLLQHSSIFADSTYAKPFFLTYLNTSTFMLAMIPNLIRTAYRRHRDRGDLYDTIRSSVLRSISKEGYRPLPDNDTVQEDSQGDDSESEISIHKRRTADRSTVGDRDFGSHDVREEGEVLGIIPTARLAFTFCMLWFGANYFAMSCLQYTTVASTTILTSTSSFWTLLIGALTHTEKFTWRKLFGVLMSFAGILLISKVDLSARTDGEAAPTRREDTFPDKPAGELALGDALALLSAILYGVYTVMLKKATVTALPRSINMPLFFGFVGTFNFIFLAPLFPILHFTGLEPFAFPPTRRIWTVLIINSVASFASDICWAYAMVLTSPLLVTVGLSLTIPLSLVGEMVLQGHYEGWVYWVGAGIVVGSFLFIDQEEKREEESEGQWHERPDMGVRDEEREGEVDLGGHSTSALGYGAGGTTQTS